MRRRRIIGCQPVSRRSGVKASVMSRKRSPQSPSSCSIFRIGLAPRRCVNPFWIKSASGTSISTNSAGLMILMGSLMGTVVKTRGIADIDRCQARQLPIPPPPICQRGDKGGFQPASANRAWGSFLKSSIIFVEIHAGVQRSHLIGVAVEHQRRALEQIADAALLLLGPARMVVVRVDVGVKAVFVGRH